MRISLPRAEMVKQLSSEGALLLVMSGCERILGGWGCCEPHAALSRHAVEVVNGAALAAALVQNAGKHAPASSMEGPRRCPRSDSRGHLLASPGAAAPQLGLGNG